MASGEAEEERRTDTLRGEKVTQQEQFEADYLAALHARPSMGQWLRKLSDGKYADTQTNNNFKVWLQQAKRHEAELSELRAKAEAQAVPVATVAGSGVQWIQPQASKLKSGAALYADPPTQAVSVPDMQTMVNRFLSWKLPRDFCPDAGVSFKPSIRQLSNGRDWAEWPSGTNLLNAEQAREMLEYMLAAAPQPEQSK